MSKHHPSSGARADGPHLESLDGTAAEQVTAMAWARYLGSAFGSSGAIRALRYYRDVSWISQDVYHTMVDYVRGLSVDELTEEEDAIDRETSVESLRDTPYERHARSLGVLRFTLEDRDALFTPAAIASLEDPDTVARVLRYFDAPKIEALTDRMLYTDLMIRVPDHNLVMGDRMSMACSLEVRSPFVDPRVVQFAASLPAEMKLKGRSLKYLLRRLARRYLPEEITRLPKQGFGFPVGIWMRRELSGLVEARLRASRLVAAGVFRQGPIDRLLDEHMQGRVDHSYRLWLLLNLEIWYEIYIEGRDVAAVAADIGP